MSAPLPLPLAAPGRRVRIVSFASGTGVERRLAGMGLTVGSEVEVVQQQGGGLLLAVGETRLAIGAGLAHKILVSG